MKYNSINPWNYNFEDNGNNLSEDPSEDRNET